MKKYILTIVLLLSTLLTFEATAQQSASTTLSMHDKKTMFFRCLGHKKHVGFPVVNPEYAYECHKHCKPNDPRTSAADCLNAYERAMGHSYVSVPQQQIIQDPARPQKPPGGIRGTGNYPG